MENTTEKQAIELIEKLNDKDLKNEVKEVQVMNPMKELGEDLFSFFKDRLELIKKDKEFKDEMEEVLRDKIKNDPSITFSQVSNLFINHSQQISFASEQVISLLKPPQGSPSNPLFDSIKKNDIEKIDSTNFDSETQRKIDMIYRMIEGKILDENKKK